MLKFCLRHSKPSDPSLVPNCFGFTFLQQLLCRWEQVNCFPRKFSLDPYIHSSILYMSYVWKHERAGWEGDQNIPGAKEKRDLACSLNNCAREGFSVYETSLVWLHQFLSLSILSFTQLLKVLKKPCPHQHLANEEDKLLCNLKGLSRYHAPSPCPLPLPLPVVKKGLHNFPTFSEAAFTWWCYQSLKNINNPSSVSPAKLPHLLSCDLPRKTTAK